MLTWRNGPSPKWPLCNDELIPWLENYISPAKWTVELTGGEPSLYEGLDDLCLYLSENGYLTVIRTNGLLEIKSYPHILRVAAFHHLENPPRFFDEILIVDKLQRDEKERICRKNGWKYRVVGYNGDASACPLFAFERMAFINNAGHQTRCPVDIPLEQVGEDGVDYGRISHRGLVAGEPCLRCKIAGDARMFFEDLLALEGQEGTSL